MSSVKLISVTGFFLKINMSKFANYIITAQNLILAVFLNFIVDVKSIANYFIASAIVTMLISSMFIELNYWSKIEGRKPYLIRQIVESLVSVNGIIIFCFVIFFYFFLYNNPSIELLKWFSIMLLSEILSVKDRFNMRYGLKRIPWQSVILKISILFFLFQFDLNYTLLFSFLMFLIFIYFERNISGIHVLEKRSTISSKAVGSINSVQGLFLNGELELSSTSNVFIDNMLFRCVGFITVGVKTMFETKILENKKFLLKHWFFLSPIIIILMLNKSLGLTFALVGLINLVGKSDFLRNYINNDLNKIHISSWLFSLVFIISSVLDLAPFISFLNSIISSYFFALYVTFKSKSTSDYLNLIIGLMLIIGLYVKYLIYLR